MKIIQDGGGYTTEELLEYKYIIFANCVSQMKCLVDAGIKMHMGVSNPQNKVYVCLVNLVEGHSRSHRFWCRSCLQLIPSRRILLKG